MLSLTANFKFQARRPFRVASFPPRLELPPSLPLHWLVFQYSRCWIRAVLQMSDWGGRLSVFVIFVSSTLAPSLHDPSAAVSHSVFLSLCSPPSTFLRPIFYNSNYTFFSPSPHHHSSHSHMPNCHLFREDCKLFCLLYPKRSNIVYWGGLPLMKPQEQKGGIKMLMRCM